jgi:hypothetical protein
MLISKMQTYLSDEMLPQKLKLKNKKIGLGITVLENSFLILTFWGDILSLGQYCFFLNQHKIPNFLYPTVYDLFSRKKTSPLRRAVFPIVQHKNLKK